MRTPLSRARGLGAAGEGTVHWWMQRVTSITLVPLVLWFGFSLAGLGGLSHARVAAWMQEPVTATLLIAFLIVSCYHMALGLRVIVEDYVHVAALKIGMVIAVEVGSFVLALIGVISVMRVFF